MITRTRLVVTMLKEYEHKGVVVIPSVFTEEECDRIKSEAYGVTDDQIKTAGYKHAPSEQAYNKKSLIFFPALANTYLNDIRIDDRMQNVVRMFLGDDVRQINNQIYFREQEDLDTFAWHRDTIFREGHIFTSSLATDYLQTIIAVDDITEDNSPVEFIEGSHEWPAFGHPHDLRIFERGAYSGKKYTAKKGDMMVWSVMIVHGSEENKSTSSRMTYMNGFCRTRSASTYPDYLLNGKIVEKVDPKKIP
jgi:ectoine hydroxylase-related dioxygenase (phytanoyl-CoA dioxygenase family)